MRQNDHTKTRMTTSIKVRRTNINTCRESELNNQNINLSLNIIVSIFVVKLLKLKLLFKNIHLGLDFKYVLLKTFYLVVIGISISKIR